MNLAMYILVNPNLKLEKLELAKLVSSSLARFYKNKTYSEELMSDYMVSQKKIILKCPEEILSKYSTNENITIHSNTFDKSKSDDIVCVNIGIFDRDKNEVPDDIKKLKLYSR